MTPVSPYFTVDTLQRAAAPSRKNRGLCYDRKLSGNFPERDTHVHRIRSPERSAVNGIRTALGIGGVLSVIVGILILAWPGKTAMVVTAIIAIYAIAAGLVYAGLGIFPRTGEGGRASATSSSASLFIIAGIVAFLNLGQATAGWLSSSASSSESSGSSKASLRSRRSATPRRGAGRSSSRSSASSPVSCCSSRRSGARRRCGGCWASRSSCSASSRSSGRSRSAKKGLPRRTERARDASQVTPGGASRMSVRDRRPISVEREASVPTSPGPHRIAPARCRGWPERRQLVVLPGEDEQLRIRRRCA